MERRNVIPALAVALFALVGLAFSVVSTYDFINHLDRQVHSIHCGFFPGSNPDATGTSGCHTVMMSPYSSLLRENLWGGLPISLLALGVFGYLLFRAIDLVVRRQSTSVAEARFLLAGTGLPLLMTVIYGTLSMQVLKAVCTNCVGVYVASIGGFVSAVLLLLGARKVAAEEGDEDGGPVGTRYALYFTEGVVFVMIPVLAFLAMRPDYDKVINQCGELVKTEDPDQILVPLHASTGGASAIEVLDPLCPACRAFDERIAASGHLSKLDLQAVLFPLDSRCNWMVKSEIHPGACLVSEAVLCAGTNAGEVVSWAFEHQEELKELAKQDQEALAERITTAFPNLKTCVGSKGAQYKLNRSLRWAVANRLPVLTPQLYVEGKKICDEDTDLGLDYALGQMLSSLDGRASAEPLPEVE